MLELLECAVTFTGCLFADGLGYLSREMYLEYKHDFYALKLDVDLVDELGISLSKNL